MDSDWPITAQQTIMRDTQVLDRTRLATEKQVSCLIQWQKDEAVRAAHCQQPHDPFTKVCEKTVLTTMKKPCERSGLLDFGEFYCWRAHELKCSARSTGVTSSLPRRFPSCAGGTSFKTPTPFSNACYALWSVTTARIYRSGWRWIIYLRAGVAENREYSKLHERI